MNSKQTTTVIIIFVFVLILMGIVSYMSMLPKAEAKLDFECKKYKYSTEYNLYGIYTGSSKDFNYFLGDRRSIDLGSCNDNGKTLQLYRTEANEAISEQNQVYLNNSVVVELTDLQLAIQLVLAAGLTISNK